MKHLWIRKKKLLRGPIHIFLAIALALLTYCFCEYMSQCIYVDPMCFPIDKKELTIKWAIVVSQFSGIGLLLWDLDSKIQALTRKKLITYFCEKFNAWLGLWKRPVINTEINSTWPMLITSVEATATTPDTDKSLEQKLEEIFKTLKIHQAAIAKTADSHRLLEAKLVDEIKEIKKIHGEEYSKISHTVTALHVGGYTRQLWSFYFIAYSAVLSAFV